MHAETCRLLFFVGHAIKKIDEFGRSVEGAMLSAKIGKLWRRGLLRAKILMSEKIVTLFSYMFWLSVMKFGTTRGICA